MKKQNYEDDLMDMEGLFGDEDPARREAYEYLEKANMARNKKQKLEYIEKALEVCPDSFEAKVMLASYEENPLKVLATIDKAVNSERNRLKKKGAFGPAKTLMGIFEIMPFVHGLYNEAFICANMGMIQKALELARETLKHDIDGLTDIRYLLMAIYAYLEDGDNLKKHYKRIDEDNLQTLIPMLVYYFKRMNYKEALKYLDKIRKHNKYFMKIFEDLGEELVEEVVLGSESELRLAKENLAFLLITVPALEYFVVNEGIAV